MPVVFFSYGTRGDVQPQIALAAGLEAQGIRTRIAAPENLRSFVEAAGLPYAPLYGNSQEIMESEEGQRWLQSGNVGAFMKEVAAISARIDAKVFRCGLEAVRDADAIVGGTLAEDLAYTLAEHRRVPFVFGHTIPFETTGDYACPIVTPKSLPLRALNRASYSLFRMLARRMHADTLRQFRAELGLPPRPDTVVSRGRELDVDILQLWSRHLVPHPSDAPPRAVTTGFLRLPQEIRTRLGERTPSGPFAEWIETGPAPVYIGFGSMPVPSLDEFFSDVLAISRSLGIRIALSPGWNDAAAVRRRETEDVRLAGPVDHGWLFPRCAAIVHHGGAGTTAAGLEAGVPAVVCSVFADQPFWGARLERLGVGSHLPRTRMTRDTLGAAIRQVLAEDVRAAARDLGAKLMAEDGNAVALSVLGAAIGAGSLTASRPERSSPSHVRSR